MADEEIFGLPETLPPFRLRTELPTIVRELCPKALHIAVWLAIRWLLAGERQRALSTRDIAACAKVNVKSVSKIIENLLTLRLIEIVAYADVPNKNLTGAPHGSPMIRIPKWIEQENAHFTAHFLAQLEPAVADRMPDEQLRLDFGEQQREGSDPKTDQALIQKRIRPPDPKTDQGARPFKLNKKNLKEGKKVDLNVRYRTPDGEPPLADHPFDLWYRLNPNANTDDAAKLARLAADHDAPYRAYPGGYGMYWVGRALQAANKALDPERPITLNYVRNILTSWRNRTTEEVSAYGTDAPSFQRKLAQRQRRAEQQAAADQPAAPVVIPSDLAALWQRVQARLRAHLTQGDFDTWIRETALLNLDSEHAVVGCPNIFAREKLETQFLEVMTDALAAELGQRRTLEIVIASTLGAGD